MPQQNVAAINLNPPRSDSPADHAARSPGVGQSRMCIETERLIEEGQRPSIEPSRAIVPGPAPFTSNHTDQKTASAITEMSFGRFRVFPNQRLIIEGDRPLRLGSRALDILVALVERAGELVSKGDLMARIWPDTIVDEGNLKVQVAALRRALRDGEDGNRYISNVAGRGYWFVAPVVRSKAMDTDAGRYRRVPGFNPDIVSS
jgi:DNA-binding winged helix-turn-helix (wHTH) protein